MGFHVKTIFSPINYWKLWARPLCQVTANKLNPCGHVETKVARIQETSFWMRTKSWYVRQNAQSRTIQIIDHPVLNAHVSMIVKPFLQQTSMRFESVKGLRASRQLVALLSAGNHMQFQWQWLRPPDRIQQMQLCQSCSVPPWRSMMGGSQPLALPTNSLK